MALDIQEVPGGDLITVTVSGKLVKDDYVQFVPQIEALLQRVGKLRILLVMKDFHGWDLEAVWEDIKFDVRHFSDIEKLAMVGDARWEKWMAGFCKPFTTAQIRYFDESKQDAALDWLQDARRAPSPQG